MGVQPRHGASVAGGVVGRANAILKSGMGTGGGVALWVGLNGHRAHGLGTAFQFLFKVGIMVSSTAKLAYPLSRDRL
jgi:hypothetical protein